MSACRYDRDKGDYLIDGEPCKRDEYGDPTRHCTARRTCAQHIGAGELTCARCVSRARQDVRAVRDFAALMPTAALSDGVNSEAANLAGPAADVEAWSWRKIAAKQGGPWHLSLVEDDDDWHPYTVLTRWEFMLREDYRQRRPAWGCRVENVYELEGEPVRQQDRNACHKHHGPACWWDAETPTSTTAAADYLDRNLHRVAQDETQDFALLAREVRRCRQHLEAVIHDSRAKEHGAPCPQCADKGGFVRLFREYAHWCTAEECEQIHYDTDEADRWVCPRDRLHWWSEKDYRSWVEERTTA